MEDKKTAVTEVIAELDYLSLISEPNIHNGVLEFEICYQIGKTSVNFEVTVFSSYPYRLSESESILFKNKQLIQYNHVMGDGSVCFHNIHCDNLKDKLTQDFESIKNWIIKYIINNEEDEHYEFPIKAESTINDKYYAYLFTDIDHQFKKGDFGSVLLSAISASTYKGEITHNFLVNSFNKGLSSLDCGWSRAYFKKANNFSGLFYFLNAPPVENERFLVDSWKKLSHLISQEFITYIWQFCFEARG